MDRLELAIPFVIAIAIMVLAAIVTRAAERTVDLSFTRIEDRRKNFILGVETGVNPANLSGTSEREFRNVATWLGEIGSLFSGYVGLVGADILLMHDLPGNSGVMLGSVVSAFLGAVVLVVAAVGDAEGETRRHLFGLFSKAQLALVILNVLSAGLIFVPW